MYYWAGDMSSGEERPGLNQSIFKHLLMTILDREGWVNLGGTLGRVL